MKAVKQRAPPRFIMINKQQKVLTVSVHHLLKQRLCCLSQSMLQASSPSNPVSNPCAFSRGTGKSGRSPGRAWRRQRACRGVEASDSEEAGDMLGAASKQKMHCIAWRKRNR